MLGSCLLLQDQKYWNLMFALEIQVSKPRSVNKPFVIHFSNSIIKVCGEKVLSPFKCIIFALKVFHHTLNEGMM